MFCLSSKHINFTIKNEPFAHTNFIFLNKIFQEIKHDYLTRNKHNLGFNMPYPKFIVIKGMAMSVYWNWKQGNIQATSLLQTLTIRGVIIDSFLETIGFIK